jgi:hypothetical protein
MSAPTPDRPDHNKPTPEDLAGIPVCLEEGPTTRVEMSSGARVGGGRDCGGPPEPFQGPPTADDLAGTPACFGDEEG